MSFIQKLFTSRDNQTSNVDAETGNIGNTFVGQQDRIWWNPDTNAFYYSDGNTAGGIPIGTASGSGIPLGPINSVQINAGGGNFAGSSNLVFSNNVLNVVGNVSATGNVAASYFIGNVSTTGNIVGGNILSNNYLYANGNSIFANIQLTGNIDLGNLYIIDETIYGKNTDQDIAISPRGTGYVSVPKLKIPVGTLLEGTQVVVPIVDSLTLSSVLDYSTGPSDTLPSGTYGIPGGVNAPWAAYQFTTVPEPALEPQDIVSGAGVPADSEVVYIGTGVGNTNIVVTTQTYQGLPTPVPTPGTTIAVARALTKAGLSISTIANTDIALNPGDGGNIIIDGSILPLTDNEFSIGSPARRIKSIYTGGGTIYIFDDVLGVDQAISASNGNLVVQGGTGLNVGSFTFFGNTIAIANSSANITIGTEVATGNVVFNRPIAVNANIAFPHPTFAVTRSGLVTINPATSLSNTEAAFNVIGSTSANSYPRNFSATLVQLTNVDDEPARISMDAFGANIGTGQNAYGLLAARVARGNVDVPAQTQANDVMMRLTSQGFNNAGAFQSSIVRYNQIARENFTTTAAGTRHNFQATPTGTVTIKNIANIDAQGITLSSVATGGPANIGITFQDGSYQNTAWVPSNNVNSLTAGAGISLSASTGNITIGSTGVLGVNGTTNQINVANVGNVLTLSLPQNFNTTANVQLYSLTVTDLTVLGNTSNVTPAVVSGKIVYVANNATNLNGIDVSGIVTGNAANGYYAGMLYSTTSNTWQMDIGNSNGITADTIYTTNIVANANIHLGNAYNNYDFPEALIQGDTSIDSYTQIVLKNHFQGANASADFVAVSNNGDDTVNYIDFGINSNVYSNADYAVTGYNDGYLYTNGGNLAIGTQTAAKVINIFTGGTNSLSQIRGTISDTGLSMVGNVTANNMISSNATIGGTVSASGNVSAAGNVIGGNLVGQILTPGRVAFVGSGKQVTDNGNFTFNSATNVLSVAGNVNAANFNGVFNGNIVTSGNVSTAGNVIGAYGVFSSGNTVINAGVSTTGNVTGGNILTAGVVSATGNVTGNYFLGNGSQLTGLPAAYGNANVANFLANYGANTVSTTGNITANYFIGNGSQLTGVIKTLGNAFTTISSNGVSITANTSTSTATLTPGNNITIVGNASTNITVFSVVDAPVFTGNITGGNIRTTGLITATGNVTGGNIRTVGLVSATGNVTGNYIFGNGSQLTGLVAPVNADWTSTSGLSQILHKTGASGPTAIALGQNAAGNAQGTGAIAIGVGAAGSATTSQGVDAIAIGTNAGGALAQAQGDGTIAIGKNAGGAGFGTDGQQTWSIAVGTEAGTSNQAAYSVALGAYAGRYNQGSYATALGQAAGLQSQGQGAVAIGQAGYESQGQYAIAIGSGAGDTNQGNNAIAIGYQAGTNNQTANSIILNASGSALESSGIAGLFINPVRNNLASNANVVFFNTSTKELTYANTISLAGNITGSNLITSGLITATGNVTGGNIRTAGVVSATGNVTGNYFIGNGSQLTGVITTITPNALSSTVHVAAVTTGNTANIITDATTANTANTIVVRDANGAINVSGWTVGTHLTAVDYTATNSDYWIGTTAKNKTITLPNAANGASTGRQYQIADAVHTGNPGTTIAAQSPATVVGNQPSQQGQIIIATYVGGVWYCN